MMDTMSLANFLAYSAQIACVIVAGALLPSVLRLDAPGVRYNYWRALGLLCLALPWIQPRAVQPVTVAEQTTAVASSATAASAQTVSSGAFSSGVGWWEVAIALLAIGTAARLVWLAAGLRELRRLRTAGEPAGPNAEHDDLQKVLGTRAQIRFIEYIAQPVTFGVLRPVVLLPAALRGHPEHVRRAVLAHELIHVQRRDWACVLVEEVLRAVFWFHPAAWWLISRVQLAREEVVDELAVLVTGRRRTYVEALLAFADDTPLAPAAAFARRRHLFRRMMLISKEAAMSSKRIVASCALMVLVVACGSWYAVGAFPLVTADEQAAFQQTLEQSLGKTPGPLERRAVPITPENPIPRRVNVTAAEYPSEARTQHATGVVTVQVTLDNTGTVAEARVTRFHVRAPTGELSFQNVTAAEVRAMAKGQGQDVTQLEPVVDAFIRSAVAAVQQWRYDPPYQAPISFPVTINFTLGSDGAGAAMPPPPPPPPPPGPASNEQSIGWTADGGLRVGGAIKPPTKIRDVRPEYPPIALASGVQGVVILEIRIAPDGRVSDARVLRSIPLLDQAAIAAVKQWAFTPTRLNGAPVPVVMTVTVNFTTPQ